MVPALRSIGLAVGLVVMGCGAPGAPADTGARTDEDAALMIVPPTVPSLAPCRAGWIEREGACEPWPASGRRDDCAPGTVQRPGQSECEPLSGPCPSDGWPADLPADRPIFYVDDDAVPGGDGQTRGTAWQTVGVALAATPPDALIAVAVGRYDDRGIVVTDMRELRGACTTGTLLTATEPRTAAVELVGGGASLRDVMVDAPDNIGIQVSAFGVTIERVAVHRARGTGITVRFGDATLRHVVVSSVREAADARVEERGIDVSGETDGQAVSATLADVHVTAARGTGLFVGRAGAVAVGDDITITRMLPAADGTAGRGVEVQRAALLTLRGLLVEDALEIGVIASGAGTRLDVEDALVRRVAADPATGESGRGLDVEDGAVVTASRMRVERATEAAVVAAGPGTDLSLSDLVVEDTLARPDGRRGRALDVSFGAHVRLLRGRFVRSRDMGVFANIDAVVDLEDLLIDGVEALALDSTFGAGVWAQGRAAITLRRTEVRHVHVAGVASVDHSFIELEDVTVTDVTAAPCGASCPDVSGGHGLTSHDGGRLRARGFVVRGCELCGVVVGGPHFDGTRSEMDLSGGSIGTAAVGACVQDDLFDSERLRTGVVFVDVGLPLQATSYPLPTVR